MCSVFKLRTESADLSRQLQFLNVFLTSHFHISSIIANEWHNVATTNQLLCSSCRYLYYFFLFSWTISVFQFQPVEFPAPTVTVTVPQAIVGEFTSVQQHQQEQPKPLCRLYFYWGLDCGATLLLRPPPATE